MSQNIMDSALLDKLRYPIGKFEPAPEIYATEVATFVADIAALPAQLREAVAGLTNKQLDTPYRPGGWTVRQTVHHVADSHLNSYVRFKLALTEENPTIKPYEEQLWAELADGKLEPVEVSLILLEALHHRWVIMLQSLAEADWQRCFLHPVSGKTALVQAAGLYAWHGKHHVAHITNLRQQNQWY